MSKAVLVIDEMPDNCFKCKLCQFAFDSELFEDGEAYCVYESESIQENFDNESKPEWCPLRALPEKKSIENKSDIGVAVFGGWNACIDEITGETNCCKKCNN